MSAPYRVVIVGGGTAGWMTAAYLSKALQKSVEITVIESPSIQRIGVGEATFSTIRLFFEFLGLDERDWMPSCHASYKLAIKFVDWNRERRAFYHPFQRFDVVDGYTLGDWWLKLCPDQPIDYASFCVPAICDAKASPRYLDGRSFCDRYEEHLRFEGQHASTLRQLQIQYPYAYHFDAQLIANFLMEYAMARGVERIADHVVDVRRTPDGAIAAVVTPEHGAVSGNLFVDCTGFRGLLIEQALGERFISFGESLLCDLAVALQVPSDSALDGIRPYTTATAMRAGWVWDIPLYGRRGTGYVYSSAFLSPDAAERELRDHLGPAAAACSANHITMRIGRRERSWVKNCVAIGLSSGFVEPLESTGIFFIQHGIEELVNHFPDRTIDDESVRSYNRAVGHCIDGVRDFLTLHYVASTRDDTPFWKATKRDITVSAGLADRLDLWRVRLPTNKTIDPNFHGFEAYSYAVMLVGLGARPRASLPVLDHLDDRPARSALAAMRERSGRLVATLPPLSTYLAGLHERIETV